MRLRTTTWTNRNSDRLQRVMDEAAGRGTPHPVILDIGPGAASTFWMRVHPSGNRRDWTLGQKLRRGLARLGDTAVRALPIGSLSCPELEEIYVRSKPLQPSRIDVVDIELRVLGAALKVARRSRNPALFMFHRVDLAAQALPITADIVIAYQIIERTPNPQATLQIIADAVRPGGLLSVVTSLSVVGLDQIERGLWARPITATV